MREAKKVDRCGKTEYKTTILVDQMSLSLLVRPDIAEYCTARSKDYQSAAFAEKKIEATHIPPSLPTG